MERNFDHIDDLIGKVLASEADVVEIAEVEGWRQESEDNERYFINVRTIFERAAANRVNLSFDTDAAWQKVSSRIKGQASGRTITFNIVAYGFWPALRIAAGILLIAVAGVSIYRWFDQPTQTIELVSDAVTIQDTLPDGSTAFLNKNSSISFEYNPRQKTRKVKLKGEGFFDVKHEEQKPFVIEAEEAFVRDIGTSFNIKAYPHKDTVEVVVQTGVVQFYTLKDSGLNLGAGETGIYSKRTKVFTKIQRADTNVFAYKTGIFSFHATDLRSVIEKINEVYNSRIKLGNEKLGDCHLTVTFKNEDINTIVDIIAETLSLTVERAGKDEVILNGTGCQ